jgi:nicotinamidase-related amidase
LVRTGQQNQLLQSAIERARHSTVPAITTQKEEYSDDSSSSGTEESEDADESLEQQCTKAGISQETVEAIRLKEQQE